MLLRKLASMLVRIVAPFLPSIRQSSPLQEVLDENIVRLTAQLIGRDHKALARARDILLEKFYGTGDVQLWKDCGERW